MRWVTTAILLAIPLSHLQAGASLADIANDYKADAKAARDKWQGKPVAVEIEVQRILTSGSNVFYQVPVDTLPKEYQFLLKLTGTARRYRQGDKLAVTIKLTLDNWTTGKLYFDAAIDKEIAVRPPLFTSQQLLAQYLKSPKAVGEAYAGKQVDIQGTISHVADGGVVLECVEHLDRQVGSPTYKQIILDRPITTVKFADDSITKAKLTRGVAIEVRGKVDYLKGNRLIITNATLLK